MVKDNKNKILSKKSDVLSPPSNLQQGYLFEIEKQIEYDGVEMGVLENGIPYLSEAGLARMCGIDRKVLNRLALNWGDEKSKPRGTHINSFLVQSGYTEEKLFLESTLNGTKVNAYTEPVCLALLEYYAFVVDEPRPEAVRAFRSLARRSFRDFIYSATGYSPEQKIIDSWKHYHDRVDLTASSVPEGYFSIFHEIAGIIVPMIRSGVFISDKVIPDISAGKVWAKHWKDNKLEEKYGESIAFDHVYPSYYPQSKSNPQPARAYPEECLPEFRQWLRDTYLHSKFPKYIVSKIKDLSITSRTGRNALAAFSKDTPRAIS